MFRSLLLRRFIIAALLGGLLACLQGCYYAQALRGHVDLMSRKRAVEEVIADRASSDELRRRLELVLAARAFSVTELELPDNESYRSYADLERDYVVWNVFAAPEFSLEPRTWCYPVAGCVAYRGYFREESAAKMASRLGEQGYDVAVGGVAAYSTLGRFADPVLNTMLRWSDIDLIATIFHELAHQKLYIKGDSAFNESFATAVANFGLAAWLSARGESEQLAEYIERRQLRQAVLQRVALARSELAELYARDMDADGMRLEKQRILDALSAEAGRLLEGSDAGASNWLAPPLNNARLVSLNLYEGRLQAFERLFAGCEGSFSCFYAEAEDLAALPATQRNARLDEITETR